VAAFQDFLKKYPHNKHAAKAQYWVAETDYVERQYPAAQQSFRTLVTQYPTSKKVPNALLKMGYIAKWQGHANKARTIWEKLVTEYPKSMAAQVARNSLTNLGPGKKAKP
jgi:tol-pal system protein YbgF